MVGDRNRLLADIGNPVDQLFNIAGAVQKGVIRMKMKMSELSHSSTLILEPPQRVTQTTKIEP
jgi:hypothetical protein